MASGIYAIKNRVNGKCYVGSAVDLIKRFNSHRSQLRRGTHQSSILRSAWKKYGEHSFDFSVLLICSTDNLLFYEQRAMDVLKPKYNVRLIAASNLGIKQSREVVARRTQHLVGNTHSLGYRHTEDAKARMSAARRGRFHTPEWKAKISAAHLGMKHTPESRMKISDAKSNPSPETRLKMRIAKLGKKLSPGHRAKISAANRRLHRS